MNLEFWHFGQGFSYLAAYEVEIESWIESGFGELGWRLCLSLIWCSNLGFAIWSLYGIVHFLGLLLMFWVCCSAQWVCCLISLWHISFYGFVIHSDLLIITVDLLFDLLWHSSFSRFFVHLVHFPFFSTKQDFRGNWEYAFGLRRALWSFQVVLMGSMSTSVTWLKCFSLQLN